MTVPTQTHATAMTNRLLSVIRRRAYGLLSKLAVKEVDHHLIVQARSKSYHGVQMAIAAIETLVEDNPEMAPTSAEFVVGNRRLLLHDPFVGRSYVGRQIEKAEPIKKHVAQALSNGYAPTSPERKIAAGSSRSKPLTRSRLQPESRNRKARGTTTNLVATGV